jgi:hypothetical protein
MKANGSPWKGFHAITCGNVLRRLSSIEAKKLCAAAKRKTELKDFGDPPLEPALSVLVESINNEADLHAPGRFLMQSHLQELLETRLRLIEAWKNQPLVAERVLKAPIVVTGVPRSGSTFLHELLSVDSAHRSVRVWEAMFPHVATNVDREWRDARVWKAAARLWCFRRMAPGVDAAHPIRARTPQECVTIHSYTFCSEEFLTTCRIPAYERYVRAADKRPAYVWQKRFLQHLQGEHAPRWILKAPDHSHALDALFTVFPDALVVQTHRNPLEVLPSLVHLTEALHKLFAKPGDRQLLAEREARILAAAMERMTRFRDAHPELADQFVDVHYAHLAADPLAVAKRIYRQFNLALTLNTAERMRTLAANRSRYGRVRRAPKLDEMGLDIRTELSRFSGYFHRFGIRPSVRGSLSMRLS